MTQKNFSYNPIFRAHFWDEKTLVELPTYMYVVGPTGDVQEWRIYTSMVVKELIQHDDLEDDNEEEDLLLSC